MNDAPQTAALPPAEGDTPPPPPGFRLIPPPPPGFRLDRPDQQPSTARRVDESITRAISNIPKSAVQFGSDIVQPIIHPIQTYESLRDLGSGVLQKLGLQRGTENIQHADAVGKYLMDRYGSREAIQRTFENDPVGLAADLSVVLSGGGTGVARLPGYAGRFGEIVAATGRAIDPLTAAGHAVSGAAKAGAGISGIMTGTGMAPIRQAFEAGREGGQAAEVFQGNLRDPSRTRFNQVVSDARGAVANMREERGAAYRDEMAKVGADKTVLNFDRVNNALADAAGVKTFHGQILNPSTENIRQSIEKVVNDWRHLDPAVFHTAEGLDALKQKIGNIRDATEFNTPDRVVADQAYHAVRKTIIDQAPEYGRIMRGYEEASELIREIESELSLGSGGNINTALRKLQSTLRDNVNTSFGNRAALAEYLVHAGAPNLMYALAGQALNTWFPRGLQRMVASEGALAAAGAFGAGTHGAGLAVLGTAPFMSPRLAGETAYYAGKVAGRIPEGTGTALRGAERGLYQLGRGSPLAPPEL